MKKIAHLSIALLLLVMSLLPVISLQPQKAAAGVNQCTWSGNGDGFSWSDNSNWSCSVGSGPSTGYDLIFPYISSNELLNNDLPGTNEYAGLWFTGTAPGDCTYSVFYDIDGNEIRLAGDIIIDVVDACMKYIVLNSDITFTSSAVVDLNSATNEARLEMQNVNLSTNNLTIESEGMVPATYTTFATINGTITGSGDITATGDVHFNGGGSSYSGDILLSEGYFAVANNLGLGNTTGNTTVGNNASISFRKCGSAYTISENITFTGPARTYGLGGPSAKLLTEQACGGGSYDETYAAIRGSGLFIFDGTLTLQNNVSVGAGHDINVNGTINGSGFDLALIYDATPGTYYYGGILTIAASSNNSNSSNGTYRNPVRYTTLSDSQPTSWVLIGALSEVTITGQRDVVTVVSDGVLKGTGTIGDLGINAGSTVSPGLSPGTLNTNNLTFYAAGSIHHQEIEGTGAGEYDQINVTGTVNLGSATLDIDLLNGYAPNINDSFTIINNDGVDAVTGTYNGLAEGASVNVGAYRFTISYVGGTGNDVVLTTSYIPGPPGTGFNVFQNNLTPSIVLISAGLLTMAVVQSHKKQKLSPQYARSAKTSRKNRK